MFRRGIWAVVGLVVGAAGCAHVQRTQQAFSELTGCAAQDTHVHPIEDGFMAEGCGRRARCRGSEGLCEELLPDAERMALARATFSELSGCAPEEILVTAHAEGVAVHGCGEFAICSGSTCVARHSPSCSEVAKRRYQRCSEGARVAGGSPSERWYAMNTSAGMARSLSASVVESRVVDACEKQLRAEISVCQPAEISEPRPL